MNRRGGALIVIWAAGMCGCAILFQQSVSHFPGMNVQGSRREIWGIVRVHQLPIITTGITLWQQEGLCGLAGLFIKVGEVETSIESVLPTAGKEEPSAVRTPIVETLRAFAIHFFQCTSLFGFQIKQPKVCLGMPYREIAIISLGVHQVATIIGRSWPTDALACCRSVDKGIHLLP